MRAMPWLPDIIHASEPPQALTRRKFAEALAFHGFAAEVTPFGVVYADRHHARIPPLRQVWRGEAGGRHYVDRLATLQHLLHQRCENLQRRRLNSGIIAAWLKWICRRDAWSRRQVEASSQTQSRS